MFWNNNGGKPRKDPPFVRMNQYFDFVLRQMKMPEDFPESLGVIPRLSDTPVARRVGTRVKDVLRPHTSTLSTRRGQLMRRDAYGTVDITRWRKELEHVFQSMIRFKVDTEGMSDLDVLRGMHYWIDELISDAESQPPDDAREWSISTMSPEEYEIFCAERLENLGWTTRLTKASGDQGIDIVADRAGCKAVIQCKLYSRPVGNRAVQEVIAGKAFEDADVAAVVTNAPYTEAAQELAQKTGVRLLHHAQLHLL